MCDHESEEGQEFEHHWESHLGVSLLQPLQCPFQTCGFSSMDRGFLDSHLVSPTYCTSIFKYGNGSLTVLYS